MRICVYGAGAVGGAIAVRLKRVGADVSVVARGEHGAAIRDHGLTLVVGETRDTVRLPCVTHPDALEGVPDVVIVTVKQTHMPAIAGPLARMIAGGARVVLAMNGIPWWFAAELPIPHKEAFLDELDPGGALRRDLDPSALIGCVVMSSNEVIAPGVVMGSTPARNRLLLGRVAPGADPRVGDIVEVLRGSGFDAREVADIRREIWNKMTLWLAVAPMAAVTGFTLDRLVADPGALAVMQGVMREAVAIGRRLGFDLADDAEERIAFYRDKPTRPSLLKDYELGRAPELASGVLVFEALARGVELPAPHIATMATLTRLRFAGSKPSGA